VYRGFKLKVAVLGCGLVGSVIARELAKDFDVTAVDIDKSKLDKLAQETNIRGVVADLSKPEVIKEVVAGHDIVVGALPGFLGYTMLRSVIEAGKDIVDISFTPENVLTLDGLAKEKKVTAIVDMGFAPGITNLIVGYVDSLLDRTERVLILVGGLPLKREWPYEYKIVFSPYDLIDEYLRPARVVECGRIVEKPALSEVELVDFPEIGTLEAFNTDGLRTMLYTIKATYMKEKTLRYPGHAEKMRMLRETGFFDKEPIEVGGVKIRPIDLTAKLFSSKLKLREGEKDVSIMRVIVEGEKDGKRLRYTYELIDYYDEKTETTSMARVTGYPCAIVTRLVASGEYKSPGVNPPEYLGRDHRMFKKIVEELRKKDIVLKEKVEELEE
jgi:lysine 6-dehydrogenase